MISTQTIPTIALPPRQTLTSSDFEYFARLQERIVPYTTPVPVEPPSSYFPPMAKARGCSCELVAYTCEPKYEFDAAEIEEANTQSLSDVWDANPKRPGQAFEKCTTHEQCARVVYEMGKYTYVKGTKLFRKVPNCTGDGGEDGWHPCAFTPSA